VIHRSYTTDGWFSGNQTELGLVRLEDSCRIQWIKISGEWVNGIFTNTEISQRLDFSQVNLKFQTGRFWHRTARQPQSSPRSPHRFHFLDFRLRPIYFILAPMVLYVERKDSIVRISMYIHIIWQNIKSHVDKRSKNRKWNNKANEVRDREKE